MRPFVPPALRSGPDAGQGHMLRLAEEGAHHKGRRLGEAEGYERGLAEGSARSEAEWAPRLAALEAELRRRESQDALGDALRAVLAARAEDRAASDTALAAALAAALRLLFPVLSEAAEGREVAALVRAALAERKPDTLLVEAHPDTLAPLPEELAEMDGPDRVTLRPDPARARGAVAISWQHGGAYHDPRALLDRVLRALGVPAAENPVSEAVPARETVEGDRREHT